MELAMPFSWASHLLLLILWFHVPVLHVESVKMGLWNMYHNGSRLLPAGCDAVCASQLRMKRLSDGALASRHHNTSQLRASSVPMFIDGYGENYVQVMAGGRAATDGKTIDGGQRLNMLFASGMELTFWQAEPCRKFQSCYNPYAPVYDTRRSATFEPLSKSTPFCAYVQGSSYKREIARDGCGFNVPFKGGVSYSQGLVAVETMHVWNKLKNQYDGFRDAYGLASIGRSGVATLLSGVFGTLRGQHISFLEQEEMKSGSLQGYSFCLPSPHSDADAGFLHLQDATNVEESGYPTAALLALDPNPARNFVRFGGIWFEGVAVKVPKGSLFLATIDTGIVYSMMIEALYSQFRDKWRAALSDRGLSKYYAYNALLDTCYDYPEDKPMPRVQYLLGDFQWFTIPDAGNILIFPNASGHRQMCLAYAPLGPPTLEHPEQLVIGSTQLQTTQVFFDFARDKAAWEMLGQQDHVHDNNFLMRF